MRDLQVCVTPSNRWPHTRHEQVSDPRVLEWMYRNQDGTVRYAADTVDFRSRQKCRKTAESPDMPVRHDMGDVRLVFRMRCILSW
jgi:hypothetical protein